MMKACQTMNALHVSRLGHCGLPYLCCGTLILVKCLLGHGVHHPVVQEYSSVHYDMRPKCRNPQYRGNDVSYLEDLHVAACSNHEIITSLSSVIF